MICEKSKSAKYRTLRDEYYNINIIIPNILLRGTVENIDLFSNGKVNHGSFSVGYRKLLYNNIIQYNYLYIIIQYMTL